MKLELYSDIHSFMNEVMDALVRDEVQNNLLVSNCLRGKSGADTSDWFLASVKDHSGAVKLVAMATPPHNLLLYEVNNEPQEEAVKRLCHEMSGLSVNISGILAPVGLAKRFLDGYSSGLGIKATTKRDMRVFRLDGVNPIPYSSGKFRPADEDEIYYLPYWQAAFDYDCGHGLSDMMVTTERVKRLIRDQVLYLWEDKGPVAQAALGRKTVHGAVINAVYTPPFFRGKGYATSLVASLSRLLLEKGYQFGSLFTDLSNPISNSIYTKIGYKPSALAKVTLSW